MANFLNTFCILEKYEGGYSNHPKDRGGETWRGISRVNHPKWAGWLILDKVKKEEVPSRLNLRLSKNIELQNLVESFYKTKFWDYFNLDSVPSEEVAFEIFEIGVNMGLSRVTEFLQRALNVLNLGGWSKLKVDGRFGALTKKAFFDFFVKIPKQKQISLAKVLNCLQGVKYLEICEKNESQKQFIYGWLTRV